MIGKNEQASRPGVIIKSLYCQPMEFDYDFVGPGKPLKVKLFSRAMRVPYK